MMKTWLPFSVKLTKCGLEYKFLIISEEYIPYSTRDVEWKRLGEECVHPAISGIATRKTLGNTAN